ncbi:hypothetical protein QYM41_16315 [Kocuria sp. CPCC 205268]|uniref:hypothetical protein n=1 Tax=Kocuria oxytropis TaxID=3058913 RepID=UPI0034D53C8B
MPSLNSLTEDFFAQRPELFDPDVPGLPLEDLKEMFRLDLRKALRQALRETPGSWGVSERFEDPEMDISMEVERMSITVETLYRRAFWKRAKTKGPENKAQGVLAEFRKGQVQAAVQRWIASQKQSEQLAYTKAYSKLKRADGSTEIRKAGQIDQPFSAVVEFVRHGILAHMDLERDDSTPVVQAPSLPEDLRLALRFAAPLMDTTRKAVPALDDDGQDSVSETDRISWPLSFQEILKAFRDKAEVKATKKEIKEAEERYCVPFGIFSEDQRTLVVRAAFLLTSEMPYQRFQRFIAANDQRLQEAAESSPRRLVSASLGVLSEICAPDPHNQDGAKEMVTSVDWEEVVISGASDQDDPSQEDLEGQKELAPEQGQSTKQQPTSGGLRKEAIIPSSLDFLRVVGGVAGVEHRAEAVCGWSSSVLEQSVQEWAGEWLPERVAPQDLLCRIAEMLPLTTHDDGTGAAASKPWYGTSVPWNPVGRDILDAFKDYDSRERVTDHDLHYEVLPELQDTVRFQTLRAFVRKLIRGEHKGELFEDRGVLAMNGWLKTTWRDAFKGERQKAAAGYSRLMADARAIVDPAYISGSDVNNPVYRRATKGIEAESVEGALGGQTLRPYGLAPLCQSNDSYRWNLAGIPLPHLDEDERTSLANGGWTRYLTGTTTPEAQYIRRALGRIITAKEPLLYHPINVQAMEWCDGIAGESLHQAAENLQNLERYVRDQRKRKASFRGVKPLGALCQSMGLDPHERPTLEVETAHLLYQCLLLDALTLTYHDLLRPEMLTN